MKRRTQLYRMKFLLSLLDEVLYEVGDGEIAQGVWKKLKMDATLVLLVSLPPSFESFVSSFVVDNETITLENVRSTLHSRELRQQALGSSYESQSMGLSTTSRRSI
ncbi:hypothetical protein Tco_1311420 [Tanacetum coccineum]